MLQTLIICAGIMLLGLSLYYFYKKQYVIAICLVALSITLLFGVAIFRRHRQQQRLKNMETWPLPPNTEIVQVQEQVQEQDGEEEEEEQEEEQEREQGQEEIHEQQNQVQEDEEQEEEEEKQEQEEEKQEQQEEEEEEDKEEEEENGSISYEFDYEDDPGVRLQRALDERTALIKRLIQELHLNENL